MKFNNPRLLRQSGSFLPNSASQLLMKEGDDVEPNLDIRLMLIVKMSQPFHQRTCMSAE